MAAASQRRRVNVTVKAGNQPEHSPSHTPVGAGRGGYPAVWGVSWGDSLG